MTYKINGTVLTLQPTTGRWRERNAVGISGHGHPIYPAVREFELRWELVSASEFNQLQTFFNAVWNTGTASVDLPQYGAATYAFRTYSGCALMEPEIGEYFETYISDITVVVSNIRT